MLKTCELFTDKISFRGKVTRPARLLIEEARVKFLVPAEEPSNQIDLHSFLGIVKVYRRFIPNFSHITPPLNAPVENGQPPKLEPFTTK